MRLLRTFFLIAAVALSLPCISLSQPKISYLLPDLGAPGMNTYVEIVAPVSASGGFGVDRVWLNNSGDQVRVELANKQDSELVRVGPIVVSQNGRLISTQIFVDRTVAPNSPDWEKLGASYRIPIRVFAHGGYSNVDSFYIVQPWPALKLSQSATLGDGINGKRSRRGAMLFAGIDLRSGVYSISTADCDPSTAGDQGYLPCVILSTGAITMSADARISGSAKGIDAGPGGGGGGAKFNDDWQGAVAGLPGAGFTGGQGTPYEAGGTGSGGAWPNWTRGDSSLNGVPGPRDVSGSDPFGGGTTEGGQGTGGGTGFCFGTSGEGNRTSNCSTTSVYSGYGGGSGASECYPIAYGGGGGGFGSAGSGPVGGGGNVNANAMLIPVAGGGGGAGGNPWAGLSGEGGGGGGFVGLHAYLGATVSTVESNGARAGDQTLQQPGHFSGAGGGGAGGGIHVSSKLTLSADSGLTAGGKGGAVTVKTTQLQEGGEGGAGRVRIDGVISRPVSQSLNASSFYGPTTHTSRFVSRTFTLTGSSNGDSVDLYVAGQHSNWQLLTTVIAPPGAWSKTIELPGADALYFLVAAQRVSSPSSAQFASEPIATLSQAAANVFEVGGVCNYSVLMSPQGRYQGKKGSTVAYPLSIAITHPRNEDSLVHTITSLTYELGFDSLVLDVASVLPPTGWVVRSQQVASGVLAVQLLKRDTSVTKLGSLGSVQFNIISDAKHGTVLTLGSMAVNSNAAGKSFCIYQAEGSAWVIVIDSLAQGVLDRRTSAHLIGSVYPNPSHGVLQFNVTLQKSGIISYSIFDIRGAEMLSVGSAKRSEGTNSFTIRHNLPSGHYSLQLTSEGQSDEQSFEVAR
jgi:hypothetical protein